MLPIHKCLPALFFGIALLSPVALSLPEDREQPTHISADDGGEIDRNAGTMVYEDNVELTKGSLKINADYMRITDTVEKTSYVAEGKPAKMEQLPEVGGERVYAEAKRIEYHEHLGKIFLIGEASIKQGETFTRADRFEYDLSTEKFDLKGRVELRIPPRPQSPSTSEQQ